MSHQENKKLLGILNNCAEACDRCATACLDEVDIKMLAGCIRLDMDCARICRCVADFIAPGSEHTPALLNICADICTECSHECDKHSHMKHCADCTHACRECAEACRTMRESKAA